MIVHYTKHAEDKFFVLQQHGKQVLKEDITMLIKDSDEVVQKKDRYIASGVLEPDNQVWEVLYTKDDTIISVLTFYPTNKDVSI